MPTVSTMNVLVTGAAGFIGSNFVRLLRETHPDARIVALDALTYAGNLENLAGIEPGERYAFVKADIRDDAAILELFAREHFTHIVHFAAESHVDRSILGPAVFVDVNVMGTLKMLEAAKAHGVSRYVQVSTDEVYGSLGATGKFTEDLPLVPSSPYSASKASADHLVHAYHHTFGLDTVITRCSNNYGPYQFPEKLIPLMIANCIEGKPLPVYGDGMQIRDWLHVSDHCRAIETVMTGGLPGEVYNIGGNNEWANIDIVKIIIETVDDRLGRPRGASATLITHVKDRPGHDRRYAIDASKLKSELGWAPSRSFEQGIEETVDWYLQHQDWVQRVLDGSYRLERIGTGKEA